jgi:putative transposase
LRDLKRRGMRPPVVAVGEGALGFWGAIRDVFPETLHQRDWVHKTSNVLDSMPKSVPKRAKKAIREITEAEDKAHAHRAMEAFASEFSAKWPKAVSKIVDDKEALLRFYDFPAEHWRHPRTTNPIESTFAPVRARTDITKGPASREAGLGDDLQAFGSGRREVEEAERLSLGVVGESWSEIREWGAGRRK